jgi:hypothetical protein
MADVFTVLGQDHEEVKRMLAELEKGPTRVTEASEDQLALRKKIARCGNRARRPIRPRPRRPWGAGTGRLRVPRPVRQKDWIIPNGPWCYGPGPATVRR